MPRTDSAEAFLRRVGVPETRIGPQVPNGIDDVLFTPERGRREASPLILFVGSLIERKNPQLAVRAMEWVLKEVPDARLLLKGFGDQEPPLRDLAVRLGISSAVEFDTERSTHEEMADVYNRAWVAVFPSFRDFASLSPLEAVGCGVPTVMATRLHCAKYLTAMGCGKGAGDEPEEFAGCITALLREHGRPGLMEDRIAPVRERYSLRSAAQKLCAYAEQVIA